VWGILSRSSSGDGMAKGWVNRLNFGDNLTVGGILCGLTAVGCRVTV
jgi:hypothetical protein